MGRNERINKMIKTCKNQNIIDIVMKHDYWRAVWLNGICYFRTFDDNVIYHSGIHIESHIDNKVNEQIIEMR